MPDLLEAFHDWISEKYGQKIRNAPIKNYVQAPKAFIDAKVDVDSVPQKPTILMDSPLSFKDAKVQVRKLLFPLQIKQFSWADKIPQPKQSENTSQAALINAARRRFHSWGPRQSKKNN